MKGGVIKMQSPLRGTAKDLFLHMADESVANNIGKKIVNVKCFFDFFGIFFSR